MMEQTPRPANNGSNGNVDSTKIAVSLALLEERVSVILASLKDSAEREDRWRDKISLSIESLHNEVSNLKASSEQTTEKVRNLETEVKHKVSSGYFQMSWRILGGVGTIIVLIASALGGLHIIHIIP